MAISNLVAFFIILTTAATVRVSAAANEIKTAAMLPKLSSLWQGATLFCCLRRESSNRNACDPCTGWLSGLRGVELFKWRASLESKPSRARKFYYVIAAATILGLCLNLFGFNPIRALFLSHCLMAWSLYPSCSYSC